MITSQLHLLKHIDIDDIWKSFNGFSEYRYTQAIRCEVCIKNKYAPQALANTVNGILLFDYRRVVNYLIAHPNELDSRTNYNYFLCTNKNKPDNERFIKAHRFNMLSITDAQKIIDANVSAFVTYNTVLHEHSLLEQIMKM